MNPFPFHHSDCHLKSVLKEWATTATGQPRQAQVEGRQGLEAKTLPVMVEAWIADWDFVFFFFFSFLILSWQILAVHMYGEWCGIVVLTHIVKIQIEPTNPCIISYIWHVTWWHLRSTVSAKRRCTIISYVHLYVPFQSKRKRKEWKWGRMTGQKWSESYVSHLTGVLCLVTITSVLLLKAFLVCPVTWESTYADSLFCLAYVT